MTIYVGIDNGVSGSIGIVETNGGLIEWYKTPIKKHLKYTKKKSFLNRIDVPALKSLFVNFAICNSQVKVILERPMVNPKMFMASCSALRALEATLIVIEEANFSYEWIDSKEWQKAMLPSGLKGPELKIASKQVAERLFPHLKFVGDGDGILIAEYCRKRDAGK